MSLNGVGTALIVPPVNLLLVALTGVIVARWRPRLGVTLAAFGLTGLLVLSTPYVSGGLLYALERGLPLTPDVADPPQAIVILTADMAHTIGASVLEPGPLGLERAWAGAELYRRVKLPILVTGGISTHGSETLAAVLARTLSADFGTPVRWIEPRASDTWENAALSAAILRAAGIHSIYLVTHAWHMRRALIAFAETGITVTAAPVRLDSAPSGAPADFIPQASAWLTSYYAFHEWIGGADYAVFR